MPSTYKVGVVFEGLDQGSLGLVSRALPEAVLSEAGGATTVRATVRAQVLRPRSQRWSSGSPRAVPAAVPLRVDQDLVSVSDIAQRVGRTRESVRLLVDAKRGPGRFPPPIGVVGDGTRVWPWAVVLEWFDKVLGVDLGEKAVPPLTAAVLDVSFATRTSPGLATALGRGWILP